MQIANYNFQQTTQLQHRGRFSMHSSFTAFQPMCLNKKATPLKQSLPPHLFFTAVDTVWTHPLKHTRKWQWWTHDIAKCHMLQFQKVIKSDGSPVFWWSAKHTCLSRRAWQQRMPCTSCWRSAARFPVLEGSGLPAPYAFSAPFFGKKELVPWSSHFIKTKVLFCFPCSYQ